MSMRLVCFYSWLVWLIACAHLQNFENFKNPKTKMCSRLFWATLICPDHPPPWDNTRFGLFFLSIYLFIWFIYLFIYSRFIYSRFVKIYSRFIYSRFVYLFIYLLFIWPDVNFFVQKLLSTFFAIKFKKYLNRNVFHLILNKWPFCQQFCPKIFVLNFLSNFFPSNFKNIKTKMCYRRLFHQISKTFKPKCVLGDSKQVTLLIYLSWQLFVCLSLSLCLELATHLVG